MSEFKPIPIPAISQMAPSTSTTTVTATTTLKGDVAEEFERMVADNNLNRSLLLRQMIYHCLGRKAELENLAQQAVLWNK